MPMWSAVLMLALLLAAPSAAFATWSVIAVDRSTGRVVIASATCVDRNDEFLKSVQAVVVPGKGVAACQAAVDPTHQNQMLVFRELQTGTDPEAIIALLSADPAFQSRQFGILDLQGRRAGHSGLTNGYVSQHLQGQVPGTEVFYSIQGNILRPGDVVPNAVQGFINTSGAITDRVMAAMEAADGSGRGQPLHLSAVACRWNEAHDTVRRQDVAHRVHPDGRENGYERRFAQQRQVRDVYHRGAACTGSRPERDSRRREPESCEDASHAVRRVAQETARSIQVTGSRSLKRSSRECALPD